MSVAIGVLSRTWQACLNPHLEEVLELGRNLPPGYRVEIREAGGRLSVEGLTPKGSLGREALSAPDAHALMHAIRGAAQALAVASERNRPEPRG